MSVRKKEVHDLVETKFPKAMPESKEKEVKDDEEDSEAGKEN